MPEIGWLYYQQEKQLLERVDAILRRSGLERVFLEQSLEQFETEAAKLKAAGKGVQDGGKALERHLRHSSRALRCTVLKNLAGFGYRELSKALAMAPLYRWSCGLDEFEVIQVPGKSTLRDYAHWLSAQRMEKVLDALSAAVADEDIHVIVRGKAGAEVEFGNSLFLAENLDGFIIDHELKREMRQGDAKWLQQRYGAMKQKSGGGLCGAVADRGFDSKATVRILAQEQAFNGICPKDPREIARRMRHDELFRKTIRRRAQTEARVGVLKNMFLGGTPRAKGFENRQLQVAWAVLSHNLWVIARLPSAMDQQADALAA